MTTLPEDWIIAMALFTLLWLYARWLNRMERKNSRDKQR